MGPTWRVVGQQETLETTPNGNVVRGVRVSYQTGSAANGTVFIPADQYGNIDTVRDIIAAAAAVTDAVQNLSG